MWVPQSMALEATGHAVAAQGHPSRAFNRTAGSPGMCQPYYLTMHASQQIKMAKRLLQRWSQAVSVHGSRYPNQCEYCLRQQRLVLMQAPVMPTATQSLHMCRQQ